VSVVSILEDEQKRAENDAHMRGALPVTAMWFDELKKRTDKLKIERAIAKAKAAKTKAEAEIARSEQKTKEFVRGQLLWLDEISDVTPLHRDS
jgi:hypothetical protein